LADEWPQSWGIRIVLLPADASSLSGFIHKTLFLRLLLVFLVPAFLILGIYVFANFLREGL
jgi:hypothetical protein